MSQEQITVQDNPSKSRFEILIGSSVAEAVYELDGSVIKFTHTRVPPDLQGKGLATKLVTAGLESARKRNLKVIPQCEFFDAYMRKHAETQDLLAPEGRQMLGLKSE